MDAFYAAIEQRDRPELRGKPVIVGGHGRRGVVSTASYEAREFGVHSAMPGRIARAKCPDGVFVTPRMDAYVAESRAIHAIFARYTPLVEPLSLDEAFLDVTESRALFGDGRRVAERVRADVLEETGLTVSIGVAATKYIAKVASDHDKPDGLVVVPPGEERAFLAPLPVRRLWGAGPVAQKRLRAAGLDLIGDLQRASLDRLVEVFGDNLGNHFWALANGLDPRPVEPARGARSLSHETTFEDDIADDDAVHRVLLELSESVGRRLRKQGLSGQIVRLKLRYPPFETHTRQRKLASPTDDDLAIYDTARTLLDRLRPSGRAVRLIGVGVAGLVDAESPRQRGLFEGPRADAKSARVLRALDRIRDRFGESAIGHGVREPRPRSVAETDPSAKAPDPRD